MFEWGLLHIIPKTIWQTWHHLTGRNKCALLLGKSVHVKRNFVNILHISFICRVYLGAWIFFSSKLYISCRKPLFYTLMTIPRFSSVMDKWWHRKLIELYLCFSQTDLEAMETIFYPLEDPTYDQRLVQVFLERTHGMTVCDHVRDFIAGNGIINNIERGITKSRHMIVLLSE